jgi:hypothetical protein
VQQETLLSSSFDPPEWWYPIRRSVAAAWLRDGQFAKAADAAQQSLAGWPGDPLALLVLAKAEDGLGKTAEARHHMAAALGTWEGDLARTDIAANG